MTPLETPRLILRQWEDRDRDPYYAMNADPEVRRFFPSVQTREEADLSIDILHEHIELTGWGLWAVEVKESGELAGLTGLWPMPDIVAPGATEVGWRLAKAHWGKGYAPEAGRAALRHAFEVLELDQVVSMTTVTNQPSRRVMEKLGLTRDPADDFQHPNYPDWWGAPHVLYRITAERYRALPD
nr:GNAT family N-acetyltransferase [Kineosporia babensis]